MSGKSTRRVIIVGGGYAGFSLARGLDRKADVVLVEPRDHFFHNVAAMRAIVEPRLFDRIAIPYDRLLKRGKVMRDRATAISDRTVTLASGQTLEADIVVAATGSTYASPFKPQADNLDRLRQSIKAAGEQLAAASSVTIVGAGAVGTELAGEIASAMSGKSVHLVSSSPSLFPGYAPGLGRRLDAQLKAMNVSVHHGATATNLQTTAEPFQGSVTLSTGEALPAGLVFPVIGAKAESSLFKAIAGATFDRLGRVTVDPWLRPAGSKTLFAFGDAAATGDAMTIVAIMRQEPWLAKTILAALDGKPVESLARYAPWPVAPILVPLGTRKGASVLPITKKGLAVGPFLTSAIKGKHLFIPRYWKEFGYT
jgi:NADH dehydrogenase FAD-containing subunit